jgi:hypothetical protein
MIRVLVITALCAAAAAAQPSERCSQMMQMKLPGSSLEITKAEWKAAGPMLNAQLPSHCRVDAVIDRRTGADGKPYGIRLAIALPDEWNGSFLMQGGGGLNGTVQPPVGMTASGGNPALSRGFAVASTDSGHEGAVFDASFMADQQAALDFAYVAIGRVAEAAKQIIGAYYRRTAKYSYFAGCSTGGREAMVITQRYPAMFNGVIAGAPAMRTGHSNLADRYVATMLNQVAPKDAEGKPITSQALSAGQRKLFIDSLLKACDEKDGLRDGMIWNTRACDFDPASLVCRGDRNDSCLTPEQAAAIKRGFAGPKTSHGDEVYPGFLYDTGIAAAGGIPGLLNPGPSPVGPPYTATEMDVDAAAAAVEANQQGRLTDSTWVNLNTFSAHGGKVMYFHGVSDPWFSALDTLGYYERMSKANGGRERSEPWSRLYLVPGMGHCGGGPVALDNFDLLTAMVAWVEKGTAPESIEATGKAFPGRSRPLCAYPKYAHYKGQGDPEKAENFDCRE